MTKKPGVTQRLRIRALFRLRAFGRLDRVLGDLADQGIDIAGVPFRLLDQYLSKRPGIDPQKMQALSRHTLGGQPRLFRAIMADLGAEAPAALPTIIADTSAHPMTRFEAMGWSVYLTHRSQIPQVGSPVAEVFQYWDNPKPPQDIIAAKGKWVKAAREHLWFDDDDATNFIASEFGHAQADIFAKLWHPALKSDVFRLFRLFHSGGLHCDADSQPMPGIGKFTQVAGDGIWASAMTARPNCVTQNGFLAAPAGNPVIGRFLDDVLRTIRDQPDLGIFWLSGPGALTRFLHRASGLEGVNILPHGTLSARLFKQIGADYKHTPLNWRVYEQAKGINNDKGLAYTLRRA